MGKKDTIHFAATEKGWTSNEIGLQWLTIIFNRYIKEKRGKRLLFVDGHSSYINMTFFDYAMAHGILILVLPPHSTHRL